MKFIVTTFLLIFYLLSFSISKEEISISGNQYFIKNNGQIHNDEVLYYLTSKNLNIYFLKDRISYQLIKSSLNDFAQESGSYRFDLKFNTSISTIKALKNSKTRLNYYNPDYPGGLIDVPTFEEIIYENIVEGINLSFRYNKSELIYNFEGKLSNLNKLQLEFDGIKSSEILNNELFISTISGNLIFKLDNQNSKSIILSDKSKVNFNSESFKSITKEQFQNKNLTWITYLGGSSFDHLYCIHADENSDLLLCGLTNSADIPTTVGSFQPQKKGSEDAIIVKLDKDSKIDWCTYAGGSQADRAINIFKRDDIIWVSGESLSNDFPITANAHQKSNGGGSADILMMRLDNKGHIMHATYHGGSAYDSSPDLAVDSKHNVWLIGRTFSTNFPTTANAQYPFKGNFYDAFMVCLDKNGNLRYSSFFPADQDIFGEGIAIDSNDNVCVTGYTLSQNLPVTNNAYQNSKNNQYDAYLAKFNNNGKLIWCTYFGGNAQDYGSNLTVDPYGNFFIFGFTNSTDLPTNENVYQKNIKGQFDSYIAKFNNDGEFQWVSYFGSTNLEGIGESILYQIGGVKSDKYGNILVSGQTSSSDFPTTADAFQSNLKGKTDAFIAKFDVNGKLIYSSFLGGSNNDRGYDVVIDNQGYLVNVGWTESSDFPVTENAYQKNYAGAIDAYIFRTRECDEFYELELSMPNDTVFLAAKNNTIPLWLGANGNDISLSNANIKLRFNEKYFSNLTINGATIKSKSNFDKYVIYELEFNSINVSNNKVKICDINFDSKLPSDFKTKIEIIDFNWNIDCSNTIIKDSEILSICNSTIKTKLLIKDMKIPSKKEVDIPIYIETLDLDKIFINYNNVLTISYPYANAELLSLTNGVILSKTKINEFEECLIKINDVKIIDNSNIISMLKFQINNFEKTSFTIDIKNVKWYEPCIESSLQKGIVEIGCDEHEFNLVINPSEFSINDGTNNIDVNLERIKGNNEAINFTINELILSISDFIKVLSFDDFQIISTTNTNGFNIFKLRKSTDSYDENKQFISIKFNFLENSDKPINLNFQSIQISEDCITINPHLKEFSVNCFKPIISFSHSDTIVSIGSNLDRHIYINLNKKLPFIDSLDLSFKITSKFNNLKILNISNVDRYEELTGNFHSTFQISKRISADPTTDFIKINILSLLDTADFGSIIISDVIADYQCLEFDTEHLGKIEFEELCTEDIRHINLIKINSIQVSPNPTSDMLNIVVKSVDKGVIKVILLNSNGNICDSREFNNNSTDQFIESIHINTNYLNSGTYIIKMQTDKNVLSKKIIINK